MNSAFRVVSHVFGAFLITAIANLASAPVALAVPPSKGDDSGGPKKAESSGDEKAASSEAVAVGPTIPEGEGDPAAEAVPPRVPSPAAQPSQFDLVVQRMPPSAYPDWQTRGIAGGSLRLSSMHGMQWPYYPTTGIGLAGYFWVDNSYQQIVRAERFPQTDSWIHQARAMLRVTPTYTSGEFFVQGQVEMVGTNDQTLQRADAPDTDDVWLRFGRWNHWDIQVGRYEAFEVFHFGMGLDINTVERKGALDETLRQPVDFYYATTMYYRPNGLGNMALHLHFNEKGFPAVRLELLTQYGYDSYNRIGGRPAAIVDFGIVKVKLAGEYRLTRPRDTQVETVMTPRVDANGNPVLEGGMQIIDITYKNSRNEKFVERGVGAAIQLVLFPWIEAGVQGAYGLVDHNTQMGGVDLNGSFTQWTVGGFANFGVFPGVVVGGGAHLTDWTNLRRNDENRFGHQTNMAAFAAVQYLVNNQLYLKLVGAYDNAKREDLEGGTTSVSTSMKSIRLRMMYLF